MSSVFTAFAGYDRVASGSLTAIAPLVKAASDAGKARLLIFDDRTGKQVELDLRGDIDEVLARLPLPSEPPPPPSRGRPRLGVVAREVTLLPNQWEWLASQPGGASAALRRLVDQARRSGADRTREAEETVHRVMFALAGDLPHFEDATRAFYASDFERFASLMATWPEDVSEYVGALALRAAEVKAEAG